MFNVYTYEYTTKCFVLPIAEKEKTKQKVSNIRETLDYGDQSLLKTYLLFSMPYWNKLHAKSFQKKRLMYGLSQIYWFFSK